MQFENGALKITTNICSLCNEEFTNGFVQHLVTRNHINRQFLTREFCSSLSLSSSLISTQTLPLTISSLQTLIFYLKSHKLPLYFKQLYSCHKCLLIYDSIQLLFSHLNKCDSTASEPQLGDYNNETKHQPISDTIPEPNTHSGEQQDASSTTTTPTPTITSSPPASPPSSKDEDQLFDDEEDEAEEKVEGDEDADGEEEVEENDSDVEMVAEITTQQPEQQHAAANGSARPQLPQPRLITVGKEEVIQVQPAGPKDNQRRSRFDNGDSRAETIILRSTRRALSPSKEYSNGNSKNGHHAPKPVMESRSNKRLLRSMSKKPELKSTLNTKPRKAKSKTENDTFVLSAANKKKFSTICASLFKSLKCKFCNRGSFKHEGNLHTHYQNCHNFFPMKQQSELLLTRFTSNETKKYFQFRCLVCMKMFENFTALSQHRCTYVQRPLNIPKKQPTRGRGNEKAASSLPDPDTLPDYQSETEFFKNLGLVRRSTSTFKCKHVKPKLQNISNKLLASKAMNSKSEMNESSSIIVRPVRCTAAANGKNSNFKSNKNLPSATSRTSFTAMQQQQPSPQKRTRASVPDDVIISLVPRPTTSRRFIRQS